MGEVREALLTSDSCGNLWSACVWDYTTGAALHTYKGGGVTAQNTAAFIGNDYFITAQHMKPLLHVWAVKSQEPVKGLRFVCPGRVGSLAISHDGCYCAASVEEKLLIWQIASGKLLSVTGQHLQPITKVKFTGDGSHVVSCGEDGLVIVWPLVNLISHKSNHLISQMVLGRADPLHTLSDHSLPVTDMYVGKGAGADARLVTVSADRTLKLYHVLSGCLMLNVVFEKHLTAVTMNTSETNVYVGTDHGDIYEFSLLNPPRSRDHFVNQSNPCATFKGHTKAVTCLTVCAHGENLVSGAKDELVILWHVGTKQRIRSFQHRGTVTNAFFFVPPKKLLGYDYSPSASLNVFERSATDEGEFVIEAMNRTALKLPHLIQDPSAAKVLMPQQPGADRHAEQELQQLRAQVNRLRLANKSLYEFTLQKIVSPNSNVGNKTVVSQPFPNVNKRRHT